MFLYRRFQYHQKCIPDFNSRKDELGDVEEDNDATGEDEIVDKVSDNDTPDKPL